MNYIHELYCKAIFSWMEICLCGVVSSSACSFTARFSVIRNVTKKVLKKRKNGREQERVTPGWTDISRPGPASF